MKLTVCNSCLKEYTESDSKFGIPQSRRHGFALGSCRCQDGALPKAGEGEANAKTGMPAKRKPNFESRAVYRRGCFELTSV